MKETINEDLLTKDAQNLSNIKSNDIGSPINGSQYVSEDVLLTEEDIRLGGKPPLKTLCLLSTGPLISQVTNALYGVINTIWISKALGDQGLTAISTYQNFDTIGRSFATFLQVSATTKISSLFGEGNYTDSTQVFSDLLRFSIIFAIFTPLVFIPLSKTCVKWFGADDSITDLGFHYIIPNMCLTIVSCVFLIGCGCLQAEGRSWLFSISQIIALCLDMLVFCPLFLLGFKVGIAGAAIANGLSELIPGIVILVLYYKGKFGIKPKINQLLSKFSSHSFEALKLGLAQLIFQLSNNSIPGILVRKLFGLSCGNDTVMFNHVMAAFNTFNRIWGIEAAIPNAINIGFIPAASYAFGAKKYKRIIFLFVHAIWISLIWCTFTMILALACPIQIAKIFSDTPEYLHWAGEIIPNGNVLTSVCEIPGLVTSLLQAMKKGNQATLVSVFVQLLPVPIAAIVLYFTDKHNIPRMIYCYPFQALFGIFFSLPFLIVSIRQIIKYQKQTENLDDLSVTESLENMN